MALHLRDPFEGGGGNGHVKMATFARAGVTNVPGAVVANFQQDRLQTLQRRAQPFDSRGQDAPSLPKAPRSIQNRIASENTMATGGMIHTLNVTHSASVRCSATQMLATPSRM